MSFASSEQLFSILLKTERSCLAHIYNPPSFQREKQIFLHTASLLRNPNPGLTYNPETVRQKQRVGLWKQALQRLGDPAVETNPITFSAVIRLCRNTHALLEGMLAHALIIVNSYEADVPMANHLVQMYGKLGHLEDARGVFDRIISLDVVSWTSMIAAYSNHGQDKQSLHLFQQMELAGIKPNRVTYLSILPVCARQTTLAAAKQVHTAIANRKLGSDVVVGTELINMYGKFGSLKDAREMFDKMRERNVVSWNAMISTYAQHGQSKEALRLFQRMLHEGCEPSKVSYVISLHACAGQMALAQGKWMHAYLKTRGFEVDMAIGTALINMYGKCDSLEEAHDVFDDMPDRDVVMWTSIIAAYAQQGRGKEALHLFETMEQAGVVPNEVTFVSGLDACANQADLVHGKKMHTCLRDFGLDSGVIIGNALINMYGKCGDLETAQKVFEKMSGRNTISWSALIGAHSQHGKAKVVLQLFRRMRAEGVIPDEVTFSSVLSACSYAGLVEEARLYFASMHRDYGIEPTVQHLNRMIDILGRAGKLEECVKMINSMPMPATSATWMTLLGACRMHSDEARGKLAATSVFQLQPEYATPYILLSNIYASTGKWEEAAKLRQIMKNKGLKRHPNDSLIEHINKWYGSAETPVNKML